MDKQKLKLLVAEDHQILRIGLRLLIESWGDMVVIGEASTGSEAVDLSRSLKPDLVLMDLGMPMMNGIDASKRIRQDFPEIKIIVLTSHMDSRDISAALSAGATGYCLKDVDSDRLRTAILAVANGDVWLDSRVAAQIMSASSIEPAKETPKKIADHSGVCESSEPGITEELSPRELEVLAFLVEGLSNKKIAERLVISPDTVKTHIRHIMEKLAASDRTVAAVKAIRHKLI